VAEFWNRWFADEGGLTAAAATPSTSPQRRLPPWAAEASAAAAAQAVRDRAALIAARKLVPLSPQPPPDRLYACIDGTGVPMTSRETAGRAGKGEDGRARTREVKLGVFLTRDKPDGGGYPVRDRDSWSYIATFEPASVFAGWLAAVVKAQPPIAITPAADRYRSRGAWTHHRGYPGSRCPGPPLSYLSAGQLAAGFTVGGHGADRPQMPCCAVAIMASRWPVAVP
jgi:hypothetical protein